MKHRQLRRIDTGQWLDVLFTVDGDAFTVKVESHQADVAKALGLLPAGLEVVDADADVRVGPLLSIPPPPLAPDATAIRRSRIAELLTIPRSDWTVAQYRELLQLVAQELTL